MRICESGGRRKTDRCFTACEENKATTRDSNGLEFPVKTRRSAVPQSSLDGAVITEVKQVSLTNLHLLGPLSHAEFGTIIRGIGRASSIRFL